MQATEAIAAAEATSTPTTPPNLGMSPPPRPRICGTCLWHNRSDKEDWRCLNDMSEYGFDRTGYDYCCGAWEERQ